MRKFGLGDLTIQRNDLQIRYALLVYQLVELEAIERQPILLRPCQRLISL